jgi:hypothetical protein
MKQFEYGAYMLFSCPKLEVLAVETLLNSLIVLEDGPLHKKVSHCEHAVEVASSKVPLKFAVIDFCARIFRLSVKRLFIIKLNRGDYFNEEVKRGLNPFLVIFDLLCDFVEQIFEVVLVVKIFDGQADHMID